MTRPLAAFPTPRPIGVQDLAVLEITDGTLTVSLIRGPGQRVTGFSLDSWMPQIAKLKDGGTFGSSPSAEGRRLIYGALDNAEETFNLAANNLDQDALIADFQSLRGLLLEAKDYWMSDWAETMVWIKVQGARETYPRYAILHGLGNVEDTNPFAQPFTNLPPGTLTVPLVIERGHWLSAPPGTSDPLALSAAYTFNEINYGNVDELGAREVTTGPNTYLANRHTVANITHVFTNDVSAGTFGGNLQTLAVYPVSLFPNPPDAGDTTYFGIQSPMTGSSPFSSLVFDIGTTQAMVLSWQYSKSAGIWGNLSYLNRTTSAFPAVFNFDVTGPQSIAFETPSDWAVDTINTVSAFWIRAVVGVPVGTSPTQQNRDIYAAMTPYAEIQAADCAGDIPALLRLMVFNESDKQGGQMGVYGAPALYSNRLVLGLRSLSRGETFTPFLNCAPDTLNQPGVSAATFFAQDTAFVARVDSSAGQVGRYSPPDPITSYPLARRFWFTVAAPYINSYYGRFRMMVRVTSVNGRSVVWTMRVVGLTGWASQYTPFARTPTVAVTDPFDWQLVDLGEFVIPSQKLVGYAYAAQTIQLQLEIGCEISPGPPNGQLDVNDLILMPIDEWAGELLDPGTGEEDANTFTINSTYLGNATAGGALTSGLDIDSANYPRGKLRAVIDYPLDLHTPHYNVGVWQDIANGPVIAQANAAQRLWMLSARRRAWPYVVDDWISEPEVLHSMQGFKSQRYLGMRGSR